MNWKTAALAVLSIAMAAGASAETAFEMAFRDGTLDAFEAGDRLEYASVVNGGLAGEGDDAAATVSVELAADGRAALEERGPGDEAARTLAEFDVGAGNPLAMYFFERTIRSISEETGGSAFYVRNRIKDALRAPEEVHPVTVGWDGRSLDATEIVLAPFAGDPNLDKLGTFGDLRISLVVGEDIPGWYHTLRAETGGAFTSVLSLDEVVE